MVSLFLYSHATHLAMKTYANRVVAGTQYTSNNGYPTRYDANAASHQVTAGSIVQGNFHDPNGWNYYVKHARHQYGAWKTVYTNGLVQTFSGYVVGSAPPGEPTWYRTQLYNSALSRLNEKVRGGLDIGVTLAEAGQTVRMIRSLARIRELVHHHGGMQLGSTADVANGWLLWQYGWRPLAQDVFDAANEGLNIALKVIKTVRASASMPTVGLGPRTILSVNDNYVFQNVATGRQGCRIVLQLELPGATLDRWSSLNPISLGWELIPYSFVVDWFYNVGNLLRNTETALLYDCRFLKGYVSEYFGADVSEDATAQSRYAGGNPAKTYSTSGVISRAYYRRFQRTVLGSYPLPRAPTFRSNLGWQQLLSLAALLRQFLPR